MTTLSLQGSWKLNVDTTRIENVPFQAAALPADIPIEIPGDIASALLDAGLIPDPYQGRNELDVLWIGKTDWILSTEFYLGTDEENRGPAVLEFDFLDTVADIRLNGEPVGQSRNMFRKVVLELGEILQAGLNRLDVSIASPEAYTALEAEKLPYPVPHSAQFPWQWAHRNLLRKVACHGGWDWGITLMTGGIYEAPVLRLGGGGRISSVSTRQNKGQGHDWTLKILVEYVAYNPGSVSLDLEFNGEQVRRDYAVDRGSQILEHIFAIHDPQLWWPAGQGDQYLYELTASISDETVTKKIGFRTVEVIVEDDEVGRSMFFRINGRDVFAKGANWIPVDAFPSRQTPQVYRRLLEDAAAANMNMIRLWGGGQYEKDVFYDICDELGLMIWHDMMFACSLYPTHPEFMDEADAEIRYQITRLMDHPSIVLWCGNNEDLGALGWFPESKKDPARYLVDYDRLNEGVVGKAVRETDPDRIWWPSSPSAGYGDYSDCWHDDTKGDMHYWSVWHEGLPFEAYYDVVPRFCSEFGFQSFPELATVKDYAPEDQWNPTSPVMIHHQKNNAGNTIILSTMARYFRMPLDFADFLYLSQVQQAYAIRTAVEYWRSKRPVSMGALIWQLNDNWPVASWAGIDYQGRWKLLHYEAARFFAPVWVSLYKKDDTLEVVALNDTPSEVRGTLTLRLLDFSGKDIRSWVLEDFAGSPGTASPAMALPLDEITGDTPYVFSDEIRPHDTDEMTVPLFGLEDRFVSVEWDVKGHEVVTSLFLTLPRECELANPRIRVSPGASADSVLLEAQAPAFFVSVECDAPGRFSDGGFTLLPGRPKELRFLSRDGDALPENWVSGLRIRHLRGTY